MVGPSFHASWDPPALNFKQAAEGDVPELRERILTSDKKPPPGEVTGAKAKLLCEDQPNASSWEPPPPYAPAALGSPKKALSH